MFADPDSARAMTSSARAVRRPWMPLLSALLELAEGQGELVRHTERPWASITFSGSRHTVSLAFNGAEAVAAGERFLEALPEHEFEISRHLVADAAIVSVVHETLPEPRLSVETELLLLEDS